MKYSFLILFEKTNRTLRYILMGTLFCIAIIINSSYKYHIPNINIIILSYMCIHMICQLQFHVETSPVSYIDPINHKPRDSLTDDLGCDTR